MLDAEAGQLMSVGRSENDIALDLCVDDLCYDVLVGESDDKAVLGRVVFCAVLGDKLSALLVVGLAFSVGVDSGSVSCVLHNAALKFQKMKKCSDRSERLL